MGSGISFEVPENVRTNYCLNIGFLGAALDTIRVCQADEKIVYLIRESILRSWSKGIQTEVTGIGIWDFKLRGSPFSGVSGSDSEIRTRRLLCAILQDLLSVGWRLSVSTDMVMQNKTQTWWFERCEDVKTRICCINLASWNEVQLIDVPEDALALVRDALISHLPGGIKKESSELIDQQPSYNGLTFLLHGWVWTRNSISRDLLNNRRAILLTIQEMERCGWYLYSSTNPQRCITTVDSLFFRHEMDIQGAGQNDKFMIALIESDSMMLVEAPSQLAATVRECIERCWPDGIQKHGEEDGATWFKLKGNPWSTCKVSTAADTRRMLCDMFNKLWKSGWKIKMAVDLTKCERDTSTFLMESCEPADIPFCAIDFAKGDKIRIFGGPPQLHDLFINEVGPMWLKGPATVKPLDVQFNGEQCTELKFNGMPFSIDPRSDDSRMRVLLCYALAQIRAKVGWQVVCSADICSKWIWNYYDKISRPLDTHTWFLCPIKS